MLGVTSLGPRLPEAVSAIHAASCWRATAPALRCEPVSGINANRVPQEPRARPCGLEGHGSWVPWLLRWRAALSQLALARGVYGAGSRQAKGPGRDDGARRMDDRRGAGGALCLHFVA